MQLSVKTDVYITSLESLIIFTLDNFCRVFNLWQKGTQASWMFASPFKIEIT